MKGLRRGCLYPWYTMGSLDVCSGWGVHPCPLFQSHLGGAQLAVGMGVEVHVRLDKGLVWADV